jgi:hypothetical protein
MMLQMSGILCSCRISAQSYQKRLPMHNPEISLDWKADNLV